MRRILILLIFINTIGLLIIGYWLYGTRDPEPLATFILAIGTLIGLIWKEANESKEKIKQKNKIKNNSNSPISAEVKKQVNNYFQSDPSLLDRIEKLEKKSTSTNIQSNMKDENEKKNINVTSHNQSGGITAYNVNIGSQPRTLNQKGKSYLDNFLADKKNQTITVSCVMGDGEAFSLATEIKKYLIETGHTVNGVDQVAYDAPVLGQIFNPDKLELIIGTKE